MELQKQQAAQAKAEADREYQLKVKQMNQSQSNWEKEYALAKQSNGGGGGNYTDTSGVEKYGYFSNNYQPKGVEINGKAYELKESGLKVWNVFSEGTSNKNATASGSSRW